MKKIIIGLMIVLLIGLLAFCITVGFNKYFKKIEAYNVYQLMEETKNMNQQIETAENQKKVNYPKALNNVETSYKAFKAEQQKYRDKLEVSTYVYKVEKLFVKLGNKATEEGVTVKMDVTSSVDGQNMYNISFSAGGTYISIIDFISSIENDSELGFKIEDFKMIPGKNTTEDATTVSTELIATFVCKDILIEDMEMQSPLNINKEEQQGKEQQNVEMNKEVIND